MRHAIAIIKDEHRSLGAVLKGMQAHVAQARAGGALDPDLLSAMLEYIEAIPDRVHHPKEDEYLFFLLRRRSAQAHEMLDELEAEHADCRAQRDGLKALLAALRHGRGLDAFADALDAYAAFLWEHMRKEEEIILPLAEQALGDQDWTAIDTAFAINRERNY